MVLLAWYHMPDGTKPLHEPVLIYNQSGILSHEGPKYLLRIEYYIAKIEGQKYQLRIECYIAKIESRFFRKKWVQPRASTIASQIQLPEQIGQSDGYHLS